MPAPRGAVNHWKQELMSAVAGAYESLQGIHKLLLEVAIPIHFGTTSTLPYREFNQV